MDWPVKPPDGYPVPHAQTALRKRIAPRILGSYSYNSVFTEDKYEDVVLWDGHANLEAF